MRRPRNFGYNSWNALVKHFFIHLFTGGSDPLIKSRRKKIIHVWVILKRNNVRSDSLVFLCIKFFIIFFTKFFNLLFIIFIKRVLNCSIVWRFYGRLLISCVSMVDRKIVVYHLCNDPWNSRWYNGLQMFNKQLLFA